MRKRIVKMLAPFVLMAVFIFSAVFATGCYIIKGVKMRDLVGTYELTHYSAKTDLLAEREIKLYIVINSDGRGYYVYKDKDTELYAAELRCRFEANTDDSSKYDYVYLKFNERTDEVKFGVFGKNLNRNDPVYKPIGQGWPERDYTIDVDFNKVSKKTDLSYVNDVFDRNFTAMPYGLATLSALYENFGPMLNERYIGDEELLPFDQEAPLYAYVRLDVFNNKAQIYYAYPSEKQPIMKEFDITITPSDVSGSFTITTAKGVATLTSSKYSTEVIIEQPVQDKEGNTQTLVWEFNYSSDVNYDLTDTIDRMLAAQTEWEAACAEKGKHDWSINVCDQDKICKVCNLIEKAKEHTYDDDTDKVCNVCSQTRELPTQTPEGNENE